MARVVRLTGLRQVVNVLYKGANLGSKCCSTRYFFRQEIALLMSE